jgi:hypothetical protein
MLESGGRTYYKFGRFAGAELRRVGKSLKLNPRIPLTLKSLVSMEVAQVRIEQYLAAALWQAVLLVRPSSV